MIPTPGSNPGILLRWRFAPVLDVPAAHPGAEKDLRRVFVFVAVGIGIGIAFGIEIAIGRYFDIDADPDSDTEISRSQFYFRDRY